MGEMPNIAHAAGCSPVPSAFICAPAAAVGRRRGAGETYNNTSVASSWRVSRRDPTRNSMGKRTNVRENAALICHRTREVYALCSSARACEKPPREMAAARRWGWVRKCGANSSAAFRESPAPAFATRHASQTAKSAMTKTQRYAWKEGPPACRRNVGVLCQFISTAHATLG